MGYKQHSILFFPLMTSQNARYAAEAMLNAGILHSYHTKTAIIKGSFLYWLSNIPGFRILRRRIYGREMTQYLVSYWFYELSVLVLRRLKLNKIFRSFCNPNNVRVKLDKKVARYLSKHEDEITAVYGFEDTSSFTFKRARELGIPCIYELPIGYWRAKKTLMERQYSLYPEWACTIGLTEEPEDKLIRKDLELELTDFLIVPSTFVLNTLKEYPKYMDLPPVKIIPYGAPLNFNDIPTDKKHEGKLKLLFCGGLTQRKGLADVFKVLDKVADVAELTIIGGGEINECKPLTEGLKKHNYLGVINHDDVLLQMRCHDVMIFPSYFEGFALVVMEAMSQGLPVITSTVTSGPIEDGKNGWVISPGDVDRIVAIIKNLYTNRDIINKCAQEALVTAKANSWNRYKNDLIAFLLAV